MIDLKQMAELEAKATQGEWVLSKHDQEGEYNKRYGPSYTLNCGSHCIADDETYYPTAPDLPDAELITFLRNNANQIIRELEASRKFRESMIDGSAAMAYLSDESSELICQWDEAINGEG